MFHKITATLKKISSGTNFKCTLKFKYLKINMALRPARIQARKYFFEAYKKAFSSEINPSSFNLHKDAALSCLTTNTLWGIFFLLLISQQIETKSWLGQIVLATSGAGIFYIIFNLYPKQVAKICAARQIIQTLSPAIQRRSGFYSELTRTHYFTDRDRLHSKTDYKNLIDVLKKFSDFQFVEDTENKFGIKCNGSCVYKAQYKKSIRDFPLNIIHSRTADPARRLGIKNLDTLGARMEIADIEDVKDIETALQTQGMNLFPVLTEFMQEIVKDIKVRQTNLVKEDPQNFCIYYIFLIDKLFFNMWKNFKFLTPQNATIQNVHDIDTVEYLSTLALVFPNILKESNTERIHNARPI